MSGRYKTFLLRYCSVIKLSARARWSCIVVARTAVIRYILLKRQNGAVSPRGLDAVVLAMRHRTGGVRDWRRISVQRTQIRRLYMYVTEKNCTGGLTTALTTFSCCITRLVFVGKVREGDEVEWP